MVEKIRNIQRQEEQVSRRLREIAGENREVESAFAEIVDVLDRQRARNEMVGNTIAELVAAVHSIADRAAQQKTSGDNLSESFLLLENISQAILTSSVEQKACNEELKGNLERLRSVSEQNLEVLNDLRTLIS
jgi:methyl-accepting chemotaxis protein